MMKSYVSENDQFPGKTLEVLETLVLHFDYILYFAYFPTLYLWLLGLDG